MCQVTISCVTKFFANRLADTTRPVEVSMQLRRPGKSDFKETIKMIYSRVRAFHWSRCKCPSTEGKPERWKLFIMISREDADRLAASQLIMYYELVKILFVLPSDHILCYVLIFNIPYLCLIIYAINYIYWTKAQLYVYSYPRTLLSITSSFSLASYHRCTESTAK